MSSDRRLLQFGDPRLPDRLWTKSIPDPNGGCWLWLGALGSKYGQLRWPGTTASDKRVSVHIIAVIADGRDIPEGMQVDHKCEAHCCFNPLHLDVVTGEENTRRHFVRHPVLFCPRGHERIDLYVSPDDSAHCRKCQVIFNRASRQRKRIKDGSA